MLYEILPDPDRLAAAAPPGPVPVLQIHRPIPERVPIGHFSADGSEIVDQLVGRAAYLERVQRACARLGDGLEVRFFDHFDDVFDASILDHLHEIRRLSLDSLPLIRHPEAVARMPRLTYLRFGPRQVEKANILGVMGLDRLEHFTLAGTPEPAIDFSPFADCHSLRSLRLLGRGKNAEAIGHVTSLSELAIVPSVKFSLGFINRLASLESLKFVLGSVASITAIGELPMLRDLSFREVRNLEELGDLQRFPLLRRLQVSDQPKVASLHLGPRNAALEHLYLYSVPRLRQLSGFSSLPGVKSLFAYDSQIDLSWDTLPGTLTHLQLVTKAVKGRLQHDAEVRSRGLIPAAHPDADFFYK